MSLVEVAVALVLAGVCVSAVAKAGAQAMAVARRSHATLSAVLEVAAAADSLAALPGGAVAGERVRDGIRVTWDVGPADGSGNARVIIRARLPGSAASLVFALLVGPPLPVLE